MTIVACRVRERFVKESSAVMEMDELQKQKQAMAGLSQFLSGITKFLPVGGSHYFSASSSTVPDRSRMKMDLELCLITYRIRRSAG